MELRGNILYTVCIMVLSLPFSGLMVENYRKWEKKFHISGKETWYYLFTVIRTFVLVVISMYFGQTGQTALDEHFI